MSQTSSSADDVGYSIQAQVFDRAEMTRALDALTVSGVARSRAGARHVLHVPAVGDLASDPRLLAIASQFAGPQPVAFRATLFDKSAVSNWRVAWHQDTALPLRIRTDAPGWGPWSEKAGTLYAHAPAWALERVVALRVHLDDSTETNGPLRVLPGTQRHGVLTDAAVTQLARALASASCLVPSGGVVAMRPLTIHASSKSSDERPRRVLHIEYADSLRLAEGIELAVG